MTAVSKNVYFDVLDNVFDKYNNPVHRTIKMEPIDITSDSYAEYNEDSNEKDPKFKVGDHVKFQNTKTFLLRDTLKTGQKKFFIISKDTVRWTYVITNLNGEPITGSFYEKELQKTSQKEFGIEKVLKRKGDKLCAKWKGSVICLIVGLTKKTLNEIPSYKNEPILY